MPVTRSPAEGTSALGVFLLPLGRPGRRWAVEGPSFWRPLWPCWPPFLRHCARPARCESGNERRCWMQTKDNVKKGQRFSTGLPQTGKTGPGHGCVSPLWWLRPRRLPAGRPHLRTVDMLTKKHPKQHGPREGLGEKALDGPVTAALTRPAGDAQHRYTSCRDQQSHNITAELTQCCCGHSGLETLQKRAMRGLPEV